MENSQTQQDQSKRSFLGEWCKAVNTQGGFGVWEWNVFYDPSDLKEILVKHNSDDETND